MGAVWDNRKSRLLVTDLLNNLSFGREGSLNSVFFLFYKADVEKSSALKFLKWLYLDNHLSESIHTWVMVPWRVCLHSMNRLSSDSRQYSCRKVIVSGAAYAIIALSCQSQYWFAGIFTTVLSKIYISEFVYKVTYKNDIKCFRT